MQNKQRLSQSKYRIIKINDLDYKAKKKNMELIVRGERSPKGIKTTDFRCEECNESKIICYTWHPSATKGVFAL